MIGVVAVTPQVQVEQAAVDLALMAFGKTAQAQFVQVGQRCDHPERFTRRDIEVVGSLVTDHDVDLHPTLQRTVDLAGDGQWQVEIRRTNGQLLLAAGNQLAHHPVQRVVFTNAQQRADGQAKVPHRALCGVVTGFFQMAAQVANGAAQAARGRQ